MKNPRRSGGNAYSFLLSFDRSPAALLQSGVMVFAFVSIEVM